MIANGYLRLDRDEWVRVVEKRSAALADQSTRNTARQWPVNKPASNPSVR